MSEYTSHYGSLQLLPEHASCGLFFARDFLLAYDAIGSLNSVPALDKFLFRDTVFLHDSDPLIRAAIQLNKVRFRSEFVAHIHRKHVVAQEVADENGAPRVDVVSTVIITDSKGAPGKFNELISLYLKPTDDPHQGSHGFKVAKVRSDTQPYVP